MNVYVLCGCLAYEGREVLGVYRSLEDAREQAQYVHQESIGGWDYYEICVNNLGSSADLMCVVDSMAGDSLVDAA